MRVIIMGCGRMGALLANNLSRAGHTVVIIDKNADSFRRLEPGFAGQKITGLGMNDEVLLRAGIDNADAFVAVTNGDNTNVMAAQIAQRIFKVPRVIVRVYDPIRAEAYAQLGIDTYCSTTLGANLLFNYALERPFEPVDPHVRIGKRQ